VISTRPSKLSTPFTSSPSKRTLSRSKKESAKEDSFSGFLIGRLDDNTNIMKPVQMYFKKQEFGVVLYQFKSDWTFTFLIDESMVVKLEYAEIERRINDLCSDISDSEIPTLERYSLVL
jgi:hypothetical protein